MRIRPAIALAALLATASIASAQATLNVGDPAPPLQVGRWVKGPPVEKFQPGTIYVLEFWATWCGPCKVQMPHLSKMQKDHPEIVVIAQNVGEEDKESSKVEAWVAEMGDKMTMRVATDDRSADDEGKMWLAYNQAARAETLPATFVVDKAGKIAWIGKPADVEPVIKQLLAGTFDQSGAEKASAESAARAESLQNLQAELNDEVGPFLGDKDYAGAAKAIDAILPKHPNHRAYLLGSKFGILLKGNLYDDAYATADAIAADSDNDPQMLGNLALAIVDGKGIEKRDLVRAQKYATRAVELSEMKDAGLLDTLARAHADQGDFAKAVEAATKAVEVSDADEKPQRQTTLASYQAKAK